MKTLVALSLMLTLFASQALSYEYTYFINSYIANDRFYVYGGGDSDGEDVYVSSTLTMKENGSQVGTHYDCVPYGNTNEFDYAMSFSKDTLRTLIAVISGTIGVFNFVTSQVKAESFKPDVYFKYSGGSCNYVEACDEFDGNSTGQDEQPLCDQGQGYNGYTLSYGSSPCDSHISGEYKAKRHGTGNWTCSSQNLRVESGPIECTHP